MGKKEEAAGSAPITIKLPKFDMGGYCGDSSAKETTRETLQALMEFAPQFAMQAYGLQGQYAPLEAGRALDLAKEFMPQQYDIELALQKQYGHQFQSEANKLASAQRRNELSDALAMAPQVRGIMEAGESPEVTAMRNELIRQVGGELGMGARLTGEQLRNVTQGARAAQMARGIDGGMGGVSREAMARGLEGQRLQDSRQAKASALLGQESARVPNPFDAILNRSQSGTGQAYAQLGSPLSQPTYSQPSPSVATAFPQALGGSQLGASVYGAQQQSALGKAQLANSMAQYNAGLQMTAALFPYMYGDKTGMPNIQFR